MKKILALVLVCVFALSTAVFAADFKDMPDDWSTAALKAAVENGLLTGSDGYIKPSDNMTRAEMATIMARACGAVKEADISAFTDVKPDDWYYISMAKAVAMGAFTGSDNKLNPENPITRQEAFLVLSRVFGLYDKDKDMSVVDKFKDADKIDEWAKSGVASIVRNGYVAGSNGYINPLDNISRAEFAVVMDRLVQYYIDEQPETMPTDGNIMVRVPGVSIDGLKTDKMVVLGDGMGSENMEIKDIEIKNRLVVRCGKAVTVKGTMGSFIVAAPGITASCDENSAGYIYIGKGSSFSLPIITDITPAEK